MKTSLNQDMTQVLSKLKEANLAFNKRYPGESAARQPVHTVYGGAQLFKAESAVKGYGALQANAPR